MGVYSLRRGRGRAAVVSIVVYAHSAVASAVICPSASNQTVIVQPGIATPFRLNVANLGAQTVSIFQYTSDGSIISAGTPLDYIFLPNFGFAGTTSASFRISKPTECTGASLIATVTFVVSGPGQSSVDLSGDVGVRPIICGADFVPVVIPAVCGFIAGRTIVRRRQNRAA